MALKDKIQKAYDDTGYNEEPLYLYYDKKDVEDAIKQFKLKLQNSNFCRCGFNETCFLCGEYDKIFGEF